MGSRASGRERGIFAIHLFAALGSGQAPELQLYKIEIYRDPHSPSTFYQARCQNLRLGSRLPTPEWCMHALCRLCVAWLQERQGPPSLVTMLSHAHSAPTCYIQQEDIECFHNEVCTAKELLNYVKKALASSRKQVTMLSCMIFCKPATL